MRQPDEDRRPGDHQGAGHGGAPSRGRQRAHATKDRRPRQLIATLRALAKQRQTRMQYQVGGLQMISELENRTEEQLLSESKHRAAAKAILGARAAERYDSEG